MLTNIHDRVNDEGLGEIRARAREGARPEMREDVPPAVRQLHRMTGGRAAVKAHDKRAGILRGKGVGHKTLAGVAVIGIDDGYRLHCVTAAPCPAPTYPWPARDAR